MVSDSSWNMTARRAPTGRCRRLPQLAQSYFWPARAASSRRAIAVRNAADGERRQIVVARVTAALGARGGPRVGANTMAPERRAAVVRQAVVPWSAQRVVFVVSGVAGAMLRAGPGWMAIDERNARAQRDPKGAL